jgi:4-hydroxyacetophenone monooxygenase
MPKATVEQWSAFADDDRVIEAALLDAHIPSLMMALVHLTGDLSLLRSDIHTSGDFLTLLADPQGGITPEQQALVRAQALAVLREYRDHARPLPPPPSKETIQEMIDFVIGQPTPPEYVEFLMAELAIEGGDAFAQSLDDVPQRDKDRFHVVVVGAGMSGILAAIRLKEAGIPYTVFEKNADVGGTWFENTYPGCRVDSPNHSYSYSFAPNDWPQHYSQRQILHAYFSRCADEHDIRPDIRFETEVEELAYDEATRRWAVHVRNADGRRETFTANAVITAVGQLNRPRLPDIPGRDTFAGVAFHSARWEHHQDLRGKRVAVIGTGASAFQFVPQIAEQVSELLIFQRTPPWVVPNPDYTADISAAKHWLLNHVPYYAKWFRFSMFWRSGEGLLSFVKVDREWTGEGSVSGPNDMLRTMLSDNIRLCLGENADLIAKVIPHYPPAGKRMLIDGGSWLQALQRDNVQVIAAPITEITPRGIKTASGVEHPVDVIIYGTGFHANRFFFPMKVTGRNGVDLHEQWNGDPRAYLGIVIPGFPNFFCLYGPNTNIVVNGSIIFFSECEMRYIMGCLKLLLQHGRAAMECRRDVHDAYNERIDAGNALMAWGTPNVRSWYKNERGRVTQNWPFSLVQFWMQTRQPDPADYLLE